MRGVEGGYYNVFTPGNIYECVNVCTGTVSSCMNRSFISHSSHGSNDDGLMKGTGTGYIMCFFYCTRSTTVPVYIRVRYRYLTPL